MNQREAKKYVCRVLAATLMNDLGNADGWMRTEDEKDEERVRKAAKEMMDEMERRGGGIEQYTVKTEGVASHGLRE